MTERRGHSTTGIVQQPIRPEACVLPDGRVGVFVGARYAALPIDVARDFAELIAKVVAEAEARIGAGR